jgi:hypothetical protein
MDWDKSEYIKFAELVGKEMKNIRMKMSEEIVKDRKRITKLEWELKNLQEKYEKLLMDSI